MSDGDELFRFLKPTIRPETHFYVVHGEVQQAELFAQRLINDWALERDRFWQVVPREMLSRLPQPLSDRAAISKFVCVDSRG